MILDAHTLDALGYGSPWEAYAPAISRLHKADLRRKLADYHANRHHAHMIKRAWREDPANWAHELETQRTRLRTRRAEARLLRVLVRVVIAEIAPTADLEREARDRKAQERRERVREAERERLRARRAAMDPEALRERNRRDQAAKRARDKAKREAASR